MITSERFVLLSDTNSLQFDDDVFLKLPGGTCMCHHREGRSRW